MGQDPPRYLRGGMRRVLEGHQEQAQVIGDGPLAQVVFSAEPVSDYRSTKRGDGAKGRALMLALFRRKIFLNPMGTKLYLSVAHSRESTGPFRLPGSQRSGHPSITSYLHRQRGSRIQNRRVARGLLP